MEWLGERNDGPDVLFTSRIIGLWIPDGISHLSQHIDIPLWLGPVTQYEDSKGGIHETPEKATIAEIAALIDDNNLGTAKTIFENRKSIEEIFKSFDNCPKPPKETKQGE